MKKSLLFILFLTYFAFLNFSFVFAADPQTPSKKLELDYPVFDSYRPTTINTPLPDYFKYIYYAILGVSGLVAFGLLVYAGAQYLTSAGNPNKMSDAKDRITAAILGIFVLFASWLIINQINPQLTIFKTDDPEIFAPELPSGVLLCVDLNNDIENAYNIKSDFDSAADAETKLKAKTDLEKALNEIKTKCRSIGGSTDIIYTSNYKYVYLIPYLGKTYNADGNEMPNIIDYGALLFEEMVYQGKSQLALPEDLGFGAINMFGLGGIPMPKVEVTKKPIQIKPPGSVKVFTLDSSSRTKDKLILYKYPDFNKNHPAESQDVQEITPSGGGAPGGFKTEQSLSFAPQSLKTDGDIIAILCKAEGNPETGDFCDAFIGGNIDTNLTDNLEITERKPCENQGGGFRLSTKYCYYPAAKKALIITINPF